MNIRNVVREILNVSRNISVSCFKDKVSYILTIKHRRALINKGIRSEK